MSEDPRMRMTLGDCRIDSPMFAAMRAAREQREDVDAPYLGRRQPPVEPLPFSLDDWAEEIAAGVTAGLKAKQRGQAA